MNRLILIGNGFDLAHGMKTSYANFIEYLWKGIYNDICRKAGDIKNGLCGEKDKHVFNDENSLLSFRFRSISCNDNSINIETQYIQRDISLIVDQTNSNDFSDSIKLFISEIQKLELNYPNMFFELISEDYIKNNWSDIEALYYKQLKSKKHSVENVVNLNKNFKQIKELLRKYLMSLEEVQKIEMIENIIFSNIDENDIKLASRDIIKEDLKKLVIQYIKNNSNKDTLFNNILQNKLFTSEDLFDVDNIVYALMNFENTKKEYLDFYLPYEVLLLNFNYTDTDNFYLKKVVNNRITGEQVFIRNNHIHGDIAETNDHMIFGYGDEDDDEYKELETSDVQGLLDNVKSINYLEASNYRNMEQFIESAPYQIFIMGMSCGLADRTMLRKLFQHENCISIKPFYYQWVDKEKNKKDNFTEIIQNISRSFSNKDLLRSVVVNKPNCVPLPQYNEKRKD